MQKKNEIINELSEILKLEISKLPGFPKEYQAGFQCLFIPKKDEINPHFREQVGNDDITQKITTASIGTIWSNQGLFPIIKDPVRSVFDDCPFQWFFGFSSTSHFEYIYYLDSRFPGVKLYFRGEYGFYGEDRRDEVSGYFKEALKEFHKYKNHGVDTEIVFHVREFVVREKEENGYKNYVRK